MQKPVYNHPLITYIVINYLKSRQSLFVFDWSMKHWRNHKHELDYIPNTTYYTIKEWEHIIRIANGTDPITFALMYMKEERGKHIPLIAKLLVTYGIDSVKFVDIDKKTLIL